MTGHERRLLLIALVLVGMAVVAGSFGLSGEAFPSFTSGAAGAALVLFLKREAGMWRRPLTLGHQLVLWWYWPLVVPLFLIATRERRPLGLTLAIALPLATSLLAAVLLQFLDVRSFLH